MRKRSGSTRQGRSTPAVDTSGSAPSRADGELAGELRRFIGRRLRENYDLAMDAGHGFGHLPADAGRSWTALDVSQNARPSSDLRFIRRFSPAAVAADVVRKAEAAEVASVEVLLILASEWSEHVEFHAEWARDGAASRWSKDPLNRLLSP